MKTILLTILFGSNNQPNRDIYTVRTIKKDTIFVGNTEIGHQIHDVWEEFDKNHRPTFVFVPNDKLLGIYVRINWY